MAMLSEPVEVREVRPSDAEALSRAIERINAETEFLDEPGEQLPWTAPSGDRLREMGARGTGTYFVAVAGSDIVGGTEIVGYCGVFCGEHRRIREVTRVGHIGLRASYRGRGLGARMLALAESWAREQGSHRLELRVDEENAGALALYCGRGFRAEGRLADAVRLDGRGRAHLWMALSLRQNTHPRYEPMEPPCPEAIDAGETVFRRLGVGDARRLQAFEWELVSGSPFHLKVASEVADLSDIEADLAAVGSSSIELVCAALAGPASAIVGCVRARPAPGVRMRHDILFALDVLPRWSGRGIGRRLASALEAWARERGAVRLTTWALAHNSRGLRFAEALGFSREVVNQDYAVIDGRSVDRIGLGKAIV
jgi:RimJ/RimL family protein N-acetyltransferase